MSENPLIEIVRDSLGREPEEHEVGEESARILRTARAATRNADGARKRWEEAIKAYHSGDNEQWRRDFAARQGVHYHEPIMRAAGTIDQIQRGQLVRVEDEFVTRAAVEQMTGIVGTPMFGGIPAVEKNRDLTPYLARGFSFDSGQFTAFYRSDSIVREAVADVVAVISGATIEVQAHSGLTERAAELLGVDRDEQDRIADIVNTELILGQWGGINGMIQELLRLAMVNGAIVYEFMFDVSAPLGRRIVAISPRLPNTWSRWIQDPITGGAVAIEQTNPNGIVGGAGMRTLDLSRCIHVAIDQDGDNFEGLSLLRSARAWDVLGFEVSSATTLHWQRFGPGVPIIEHTGPGNSAGASNGAYEALARYANLSSAVLEVGAGVNVKLLQMQMDTGFVEIMDLCTKMKRAALRNSIANTGDGATGTYGWGEIKSQMWLRGLGSFVQPIERGFNNLIRRYIDTYIGKQAIYPTLKFTNFATRSADETLKTVNDFATAVQSGVYTDAELVEIAEKADVPWNGRGTEGDEADGQTEGVPTTPTETPVAAEPMSAQSVLAAVQVLQLVNAQDSTRLAPDAAVGAMVKAGFDEAAARAMVNAQIASAAPVAAPVAPAEPEPTEPAPIEERAAEGTPPPAAAQRTAATGRRARNKATEKWAGTIAELGTSKKIAEGAPLSKLDLRMIEAYFASAADNAPYPEGSPEWQEWQCMGGDAMAEWLAVELADGVPPSEDVPDTRGAHEDCPDCIETRAAKRVQITVSGRGGGAYVTHRALTERERAVAWADIQATKDRTSMRLNRAIANEQRKMRIEFMALAQPFIDAGDAAGAAGVRLDYVDNFKGAIAPILQSQAKWSSSDMRAEIREVVGRLPATVDTVPPLAKSRAEAAAVTLAEQVQARTIEDLRNAAVAMATGTPAATVKDAGLGLGRTAGALLVQAVSTTAATARETTVAELGPEIQSATYSAVMDRYTCAVCEAADGTTVDYGSAEYEQLSPPNPQCMSVANSGVNMCQCIWVYDFITPPTTRAATLDRIVRLYVGPPGAGKSTLAADDAVVVDRDAYVLVDGEYRREGVAESLEALREALQSGDASYVTCALSASSRQALRAAIEDMGARVECVEVTAPDEWLRLVNEDRGERAIPWDQWTHLIDAWEPVGDGEFEGVDRYPTGA